MTRVLELLFRCCLVLFLLGGFAIVLTQAAGVVVGSQHVVVSAAEIVGPPTYALAGVTGLLGFVLAYLRGWDTSD